MKFFFIFQWRERRLVLRKTTLSWYKGKQLKGRILFEATDRAATVQICDEPKSSFMVNGHYVTAKGEQLENKCLQVQLNKAYSNFFLPISVAVFVLF